MFTIILVTSGSRLDPAACSVSVTIAHDIGVRDCDPAYSMPGRPKRDLQTPRHSRCEQKAAQRISESPKAPAPLRLARENQGGADMFGTSCSSIPHQAPRSHARSSSRIKAPTDPCHRPPHQPQPPADILLVPHGTGRCRPSSTRGALSTRCNLQTHYLMPLTTRTTEMIAEIQYLGDYLGLLRWITRLARCNRDRSGARVVALHSQTFPQTTNPGTRK